MRPLALSLTLGALATALAGPTAHAAPSTCTAVGPGPRATCTYQSSGGTSEFTCAASRCTVSYGTTTLYGSLGTRQLFWTAYADVVRVTVYTAGVANAGDSRLDLP